MSESDLGIPGLADLVEIGSGGFAAVYSAGEPDAGRRVAVKVLRAVDGRARERFDRERRTLGMMTEHPSIVTMFRSGFTEQGDHPYLVMEYMPGGSLQDRIDRRDLPSLDDALALLIPIADALGFAHSSGIVHKDVKPANILLSRTGDAKLSDFGISAVRDATGTSQMGFSLAYAPPETFHAAPAADGRFVDRRDERSDLYSLAATLYALVAGAPPFAAETHATAMHRILTEQPQPVGRPELDRFFTTALAKDPSRRFQTAAEFATEARSLLPNPASQVLAPHWPPPEVQELDPPASPTDAPRAGAHQQLTPPTPRPFAPTPPPSGPPAGGPASGLDNQPATAVVQTTPTRATALAAAPTAAPGHSAPPDVGSSGSVWQALGWAAVVVVGIAALTGAALAAANYLDEDPTIDEAAESASDGSDAVAVNPDESASADGDDATADLAGADADSSTDSDAAAAGDPDATTDGSADGDTEEGAEDSAGPDAEETDTASTDDASPTSTTATTAPPSASSDSDNSDSVDGAGTAGESRAIAESPRVVGVLPRSVRTNSVVELGGGLFASPDFDLGVRIWDPSDPGNTIGTFTGHQGGATALAKLSNGLMASGGTYGDGSIHIWDPANPGTTIDTYSGHEGDQAVTAIHQLRNGLVVSGDARGSVHVWDPNNPSVKQTGYDGHTFVIITDIIQLDNGLVLSNGEGDGGHVWDVASPNSSRAIYTAPGSGPSDTYTYEVIELSDGRIASRTLGGVIHVWSPARPNAPEVTYTGHADPRSLLALDGGRIASGGGDGQVHIWSPDDPTDRLATYTGHSDPVFSITELSNGLLASVAGNEVHIWDPYAG